ncbi:hypothetical protein [Pseudomonas aeruginosa]|uniref:hypothetical protein n=1 Tax=Pseudomonas aeruginosa TaxID=287 RepID=UPI0006EC38DA|nr:hypothetical protein [Pseudomonas aeruginosa]APJ41537.1 hypothetical protein SCVFeb_2779 [Pseudomonas aeruginosa]APJ47156.1 hypothetical protein SCVJan_2779 [Pseudomonas aeruginosa]APJ52780.1 hypothetical protein NHmuc_2764 [Pseudomonas aeruginosa]RMK65544.1 hypothetical protein IPC88_05900 [Pseudomonas aeruginosa]CRZ30289.1 hypothetical protein PADK1_02739 [Pseudomonas aeruginosa DK1]
MSHNLAELPLSRRRALEREKQACLRLHLSRNRARERQGAGWPEWVSAELCVADDPLFVRKVVARLKAAVDWQRQRAA